MEERAPSSSHCHHHSERQAYVTCPRCKRHCCLQCWHHQLHQCDACLREDPAAAVAPLPWESAGGPWLTRLLQTLMTAFSPVITAPAFARPVTFTAVRFALLTALPLSLLAGIIPHTRTLLFANMAIVVSDDANSTAIALDVVRAMGFQLALDLIHLVATWLPYVSLVKAYGGEDKRPYAVRTLLYRAWLLPAYTLLVGLFVWPMDLPEDAGQIDQIAMLPLILPQVLPILFMLALGYSARLASGLSALWSIVVVTIAVMISALVDEGAKHLLLSLPIWGSTPLPTGS